MTIIFGRDTPNRFNANNRIDEANPPNEYYEQNRHVTSYEVAMEINGRSRSILIVDLSEHMKCNALAFELNGFVLRCRSCRRTVLKYLLAWQCRDTTVRRCFPDSRRPAVMAQLTSNSPPPPNFSPVLEDVSSRDKGPAVKEVVEDEVAAAYQAGALPRLDSDGRQMLGIDPWSSSRVKTLLHYPRFGPGWTAERLGLQYPWIYEKKIIPVFNCQSVKDALTPEGLKTVLTLSDATRRELNSHIRTIGDSYRLPENYMFQAVEVLFDSASSPWAELSVPAKWVIMTYLARKGGLPRLFVEEVIRPLVKYYTKLFDVYMDSRAFKQGSDEMNPILESISSVLASMGFFLASATPDWLHRVCSVVATYLTDKDATIGSCTFVLHNIMKAEFGGDDVVEVLVFVIKQVIRTYVRISLNYSIKQQMAEVAMSLFELAMFDSRVPTLVYDALVGKTVKQAGHKDIFTLIASVALFGLSVVTGTEMKTDRFLRISNQVNRILPDNMKDLVESLPVIGEMVKDGSRDALIEAECPAAVAWRDKMAHIVLDETVGGLEPWQKEECRDMYRAYVNERRGYSREIVAYWAAFARYMVTPDWISDAPGASHPQCGCTCFAGKPGVGKTYTMFVVLQLVLHQCLKAKLVPPGTTMAQFVYVLPTGSKHFDGYKGQKIVIINDFMSMKEIPGKDGVVRHLMGLVDTSQYIPSFAHLGQKGNVVSPWYVFLTTNIEWQLWERMMGQSNCPLATLRRVSAYYTVKAKTFDPEKGQMKVDPDNGVDQCTYHLHGDRKRLSKPTELRTVFEIVEDVFADIRRYLADYDKPLEPRHFEDFDAWYAKRVNVVAEKQGLLSELKKLVGTDVEELEEENGLEMKEIREDVQLNAPEKIESMKTVIDSVDPKTRVAGKCKFVGDETFEVGKEPSANGAFKITGGREIPDDLTEEQQARVTLFEESLKGMYKLDDVRKDVLNPPKIEEKEEEEEIWYTRVVDDGEVPAAAQDLYRDYYEQQQRLNDGSAFELPYMGEHHDGVGVEVGLSFRCFWRNFFVSIAKSSAVKPDDLFIKSSVRTLSPSEMRMANKVSRKVGKKELYPENPAFFESAYVAKEIFLSKYEHSEIAAHWLDFEPDFYKPRFDDKQALETYLEVNGLALPALARNEGDESVLARSNGQWHWHKKAALAGFVICAIAAIGFVKRDSLKKVFSTTPADTSGPTDTFTRGGRTWHRKIVEDDEGNKLPIMVSDREKHTISAASIKKAQDDMDLEAKYLMMSGGNDPRTGMEMPTVRRSIVELLVQGRPIGFGFMLTNNEMVTTKHMLETMISGFTIRKDNVSWNISNSESTTFEYVMSKNSDVGYVLLHNVVIPRMRSHVSKFPMSHIDMVGKRVVRVTEEDCMDPQTVLRFHKVNIVGQPEDAFVLDGGGETRQGDCGQMYYLYGAGPNRLLGIHHAGSASESFGAAITQQMIMSFRKEVSYVGPMAVPQGTSEALPPEYMEGLDNEGYCAHVNVPINRHNHIHPVDGLAENRDELWKVSYAPSTMTYHVYDTPDGLKKLPVEAPQFEKISLKVEQRRKRSGPLMPDGVLELMTDYAAECEPVDNRVPEYDDAIRSDPEHMTKAMPRSKSAGPMYGNFSKYIACVIAELEPKLLPKYLDFLLRLENDLADGKSVGFVRGTALKPEKTTLENIAKGKTRLFMPDDLACYLMCKKFFRSVLHWFNKNGNLLGIAMSRTPEQLATMIAVLQGLVTHKCDQSKQDASHDFVNYIDLLRFCLAMKIIANDGEDKRCIHPDLPPLDRDARICFMLMREIALGLYTYKGFLFRGSGMLPSGCLLTLVMNCFSLFKLYVHMRYILHRRQIVSSFPFHHRLADAVLFGDDHHMSCGIHIKHAFMSVYHQVCKLYACEMKVEGNGSVEELPFCGRVYREDKWFGPTMVLEPERLIKSVMFVEGSYDHWPMQLLTFIQEASRHCDVMYEDLIDHLRIRNVALVDYVPELRSREQVFLAIKGNKTGVWLPLIHDWMLDALDSLHHDTLAEDLAVETMQSYGCVEKQMFKAFATEKPPVEEEPQTPETETQVGENMPQAMAGEEMAVKDEGEVSEDQIKTRYVERYVSEVMSQANTNQYWSRPYRVGELTWSTATAAGTQLVTLPLPSGYFNANSNAQAKLFNTFGGRVVAKVTFNIFSTYLQSGAVIITASPMSKAPSNQYEAASGPHAILRAGAKTQVTLDIPFARDASVFRTDAYGGAAEANDFDYVIVRAFVLNPLTSLAASTAQLQVWASLYDAEIMQGALTSWSVVAQMNRSVGEGALSVMGRGLSTFGKATKAAADMAGTALNLVGLAKPQTPDPATMFREQFGYGMMHGVGVDNSQTMGLVQGTGIVSDSGVFPDTDFDPMNVELIGRRAGLMSQFTVTTSTTGIVDSWPCTASIVNSVAPGVVHRRPPGGFLAGMHAYNRFKYMVFTFVIAKTSGHTAQWEFSVNYQGGVAANTDGRAASLHRVIADIQSYDRFQIVIPYVDNFVFRPHIPMASPTDGIPTLTMRVITPLVAAATVAPVVDVNMFVHFEGLEVCFPSMSIGDSSVPPGPLLPGPQPPKLVVRSRPKKQGPYVEDKEHQMAERVVLCSGDIGVSNVDDRIARTIGERTVSLSHLIRRFQHYTTHTSTINPELIYKFAPKSGDPFSSPFPLLHAFCAKFFTMGVGGFRLKVVNAQKSMILNSFVGSDTSAYIPEGTPLAINAATQSSLEIHCPNTTQRWLYILNQNASGEWSTPEINVAMTDLDINPVNIYFALSDETVWGGMNYLSDVFDFDALYNQNQGTTLL